MGSVDVYYLREHSTSPIVLVTPDDVNGLIERVRSESPSEAPILMEIHLSGDPYPQGLEVGVAADRGAVRYSGRDWPEGTFSTNGGTPEGEEVPYFYMDHWRGFPSNAEVPLDTVRDAIDEFMATAGARPTCVDWQPGFP